ncbi:MAG: hypothetical protein GY801_22665 [bacterium]|nr:hypothetical protein [bacterium]
MDAKRIDEMAQRDFEVLKEFLESLKITDRPTKSEKLKIEKKAINSLIRSFKKAVAEKYFENAKRIIKEGASCFKLTEQSFDELRDHIPEDVFTKLNALKNQEYTVKKDFLNALEKTIGKEQKDHYKSLILTYAKRDYKNLAKRNHAYYEVLRRLTRHAKFLADIVLAYKAYLNGHLDVQHLNVQGALEKIIDCIATRFSTDSLFIPLIAEDFRCIQFNYMPSDIVVIDMPPSALSLLPWHLGVLWHEVGGYAVARLKKRGDLKKWAEELYADSTDVRYYFENSYRKSEGRQPNKESGWCENWLGEFFEDLFGVQALEEIMVEALMNALTQRYPDPTCGDQEHPPPDLRLQVVVEFLKKDKTNFPKEFQPLLDYIEKKLNGNKNELKNAAKEIANFYVEKLKDPHNLGSKEISNWEKQVVAIIRSNDKRSRKVEQIEEINIDPLHKKLSEKYDKLYKKVSRKTKTPADILKDYPELLKNIENACDIDSLLKVQFSEIDRSGYYGFGYSYYYIYDYNPWPDP